MFFGPLHFRRSFRRRTGEWSSRTPLISPFALGRNQALGAMGFEGSLGIIPAYSRTFCGSCNRLRVTAQGLLKTCLYDKGVFDLRAFMRNGASDSMLRDTIFQAVQHKAKDGFEAEKERFDSSIMESMSTIGG